MNRKTSPRQKFEQALRSASEQVDQWPAWMQKAIACGGSFKIANSRRDKDAGDGDGDDSGKSPKEE